MMKIHATIEFKSIKAPDIAKRVALSLEPDNLSSMHTEVTEDGAVTHFSTERITSLIATMDDFLMNAKIAEDICSSLK